MNCVSVIVLSCIEFDWNDVLTLSEILCSVLATDEYYCLPLIAIAYTESIVLWASVCFNHIKCPRGKIVLSVGAALRKSFSCPRLVLGLSSFVLFVFLLSLQCLCDALVMSQACPQVSTYSLCCLCQDLFQAEGFSKDLQRKSERPNTFLNMSFSLIAKRKTFESQYPVLCKTIFTIY